LGIIDGMRMTRYRMTAPSGIGDTVGISRGNPSSPSPGTSNSCKPYTSHYRTSPFLVFSRASRAGFSRYGRYTATSVPNRAVRYITATAKTLVMSYAMSCTVRNVENLLSPLASTISPISPTFPFPYLGNRMIRTEEKNHDKERRKEKINK
jgi:hypothetical protein